MERLWSQNRGRTNVCYRVLLIGLALVLRQIWVWLSTRIAKANDYRPTEWVSELTLDQILDCQTIIISLAEVNFESNVTGAAL